MPTVPTPEPIPEPIGDPLPDRPNSEPPPVQDPPVVTPGEHPWPGKVLRPKPKRESTSGGEK